MRCEECRAELEGYFDGESDERTARLVAEHLSACDACEGAYGRLGREQELYLSYECDARPAPAFWDSVMTRAEQESRPVRSSRPDSRLRRWRDTVLGGFSAPRFSPSLTALMVLAAIGITVGVMRYSNTREGVTDSANISRPAGAPETATSATPEVVAVRPVNPTRSDEAGEEGSREGVSGQPRLAKAVGARRGNGALIASGRSAAGIIEKMPAAGRKLTAGDLVREAEQKYRAAISMLSRDVSRRRPRLDPETVARFERTLAAVDRTIADTRRAVRRHPGDPVAAQYMIAAYSKKVEVLREMVGY